MRINCIPPQLLTDQHLGAEYLEIQAMQLNYYRKSVLYKEHFDWSRQSKDYTLNSGHAIFFYDKMLAVQKRFRSVVEECKRRGRATNLEDLNYSEVLPHHMNDWVPTKKDMLVNLERILQRISQKPDWYKYHGKPFNADVLYGEFKKSLIE